MVSGTEKIMIGGVTFSSEQVKHFSSKTENNVTKYSVWLNDGTQLTYQDTPVDRNASVDQAKLDNGKYCTKFMGLSKAEIKDTKNDDVYQLMGCEFTKVDADRLEGLVFKESADKDYILNRDRVLEDGSIQTSHHNSFYLSEGEFLHSDNKSPEKSYNRVFKNK